MDFLRELDKLINIKVNEKLSNYGEIISGNLALSRLKSELDVLTDSRIILASAYLKLNALKDLAIGHISSSNHVRVLARWKPEDLLVGASDLDCYQYAKSMGWPFYIKQWFHAKVYLAGNRSALIGSSNLTLSGFGIGIKGNDEGMVQIPASPNNIQTLDNYFSDATLVTDGLFQKIKEWINIIQIQDYPPHSLQWPDEIASMIHQVSEVERIGCSDCLWTDGSWISDANVLKSDQNTLQAITHDLSLIGFQSLDSFISTSTGSINKALNDTGIVRWLRSELMKIDENQIYFGALTAALHDALIDDPKPYRQDIKRFVSNLYGWIVRFSSEYLVDQPNHSQRIKLIKN